MVKKLPLLLPSVGDYPSRKEWERACWKKIMKSEKILGSLVTPYERRNIVVRAAVENLVDSGKGFQEIVRDLQLSPQTVSSIKKGLKEKSYRSYRERSKTERKKKVYNPDPTQKKKKSYRRYRKTKYGKVYLHY